MEERAGWFALFVFLVSHDCCVALPHDAMGLSAVCDCGISWSYSLTILTNVSLNPGSSVHFNISSWDDGNDLTPFECLKLFSPSQLLQIPILQILAMQLTDFCSHCYIHDLIQENPHYLSAGFYPSPKNIHVLEQDPFILAFVSDKPQPFKCMTIKNL